MARAKRGFKARRRRNGILKLAKGFHFDRRKKYRHAVQTVVRALHNSYKGRRLLKRNMRRLWISRINAEAKNNGASYSRFMNSLKQKNVSLNRKMLAHLAAADPKGFAEVYKQVQ